MDGQALKTGQTGQSNGLCWTFARLKPSKTRHFLLLRLATSTSKRLAASIVVHCPKGTEAMEFNSERELQDYCLAVLQSKGIQPREEVRCNGLRADIVIDRAVIELKKTLTRDAIFQAVGQGRIYQSRLRKDELWIVGQMPKDDESARSALHTARELAKEGIRVSFVDRDAYWQAIEPDDIYPIFRPQLPQISFDWLEQYRVALVVGFILLSLLVWDAKSRPTQDVIPTAPSTTTQL